MLVAPVALAGGAATADDAVVVTTLVVFVGRLHNGVGGVARGETPAAGIVIAIDNSVGGVGHLVPDADGVAGVAVAGVLVAVGIFLRDREAAGSPLDHVYVDRPTVAVRGNLLVAD